MTDFSKLTGCDVTDDGHLELRFSGTAEDQVITVRPVHAPDALLAILQALAAMTYRETGHSRTLIAPKGISMEKIATATGDVLPALSVQVGQDPMTRVRFALQPSQLEPLARTADALAADLAKGTKSKRAH